MKITFITATLTSGGSERVISLLANNLQKRGYQIEIIGLMQHLVFYPIEQNIKVTFAEDLGKSFLLQKIIWLRNYIKMSHTDVVISFMLPVYLITLIALIGTKIPVITSERNDPASFSLPRRLLRRVFLPQTSCHVVQTQKIKDYYPNIIKKKTVVICNPVTQKVFDMVVEPKEDVFINVARLFPQKNQQMLINAFFRIHKYIPTWKLKIFGEGPLKEDLQAQIEHLGLHNKVILCGRSNQILNEMNRSKVFVLSSNYEGQSNAMIEAVCLGLPIVSTNVSGTENLVEDGKNGFLCNIKDEKTFAKRLLDITHSVKQKDIRSINALKASMFKENSIVNQWELLIKSITK